MGSKRRQYHLVDFYDNTEMTCWLEDDSRLKVGKVLTLKGLPERTWVVMKVYDLQVDLDDINRRWAVGGLL